MTQQTNEAVRFTSLADYAYPTLPTEEYFRRTWKRAMALLRKTEETPFHRWRQAA